MSEAEWTVGEKAEIARDRREGFVLSPAFFRQSKVQTASVVVFASLLSMAVSGMLVSHGHSLDVLFLAIAGLSLGSIPLARSWEKRQEARHEVGPEMRTALGYDGRLVSLLIRQGDAPTGEDRGILWFEDGRLYFAGRRTSFGLVPEQARGFATVDDAARDVRHRLNLALGLDGPIGPLSLSISPVVSSIGNPDVATGALRADLDRWRRGRAWGEGQWPPTALGPCVVTERRLLGRALAVSLLPALVPAFFILTSSASILAFAAFLLTMAICTFMPRNALVWRAWWARRRLRRLG